MKYAFALLVLVLSTSSFGEVRIAQLNVVDLLGGIDYVPENSELDQMLGDEPVDALVTMVQDQTLDAGLRIRVYRALGGYHDATSRETLNSALTQYAGASSGVETLYLRAAIEALAQSSDTDNLTPFISHAVPDVRAEAARAFAKAKDPSVQQLLRQQLATETNDFVRWELQRAIAEITQ